MFTSHWTLAALRYAVCRLFSACLNSVSLCNRGDYKYECVVSFRDKAASLCAEKDAESMRGNIPSPCVPGFRNCTCFRLDGWTIYYGWTIRSAWRWHVNTHYVIHRSIRTQKTWSPVGSNIIHNQNILRPFRNRIGYFNSSDSGCHAFVVSMETVQYVKHTMNLFYVSVKET